MVEKFKISIVVPVYFNSSTLPDLYERLNALEKTLIRKGAELELIFVDDGSEDNSLDELLKIKEQRPDTIVIKLTRNFGGVRAVKCGLQYVTGDCFLMLAADLQDPPELVIQMADKWIAGSKFTVCVRSRREDPILTRGLAETYYWILRKLVFPSYPRGGYDLALMDKSLLQFFVASGKDTFPPVLAYWLGYKPEVIYYERQKRAFGKSKYTFFKKLTLFGDILLGFSAKPLRLASGLGIITSVLSGFYGLIVVVSALAGNVPVPGFASVAALLCFLLGIVMIILGLIGEYIGRLSEQLNQRPEVVVEKIY